MALAGQFAGSTMLMVAIALVMSVIVTNVYTRKDSKEHVPRWCIAIFSRHYATGNGNTSIRRIIEKESRMAEEELPEVDKDSQTTVVDGNEEWILVAKFVDRVCIWVYVALTLCVFLVLAVQTI